MIRLNNCPMCQSPVWLPKELHDAAIKSSQVPFYCPYGHKQHFTEDGIRNYWIQMEASLAAKKQPLVIPISDTSNVIPFRRP